MRVKQKLVYAGVAQNGLWLSESASSRFKLGWYNIGSGSGSQEEQVHAGIVHRVVLALPVLSGHLTGITHTSVLQQITDSHSLQIKDLPHCMLHVKGIV